MRLSEVVPWGRSLIEYKKMFSLSDSDLGKKILGCGDGPACFNSELSKVGGKIISIQFNGESRSKPLMKRINVDKPPEMI